MAGDSSASEQDPDDSDSEFVEIDPTRRYGRYKEVLGKGAFKTVYKAFDEREGIEVAWNQIKLADVLRNVEDLERLYSEVHLLKTLKHKNIIKFYNSWVDPKDNNINIITEIFTSGTLRQWGVRPASLEKVKVPEVREFIEKCIAKASQRLPARELLLDHFLKWDESESVTDRSQRNSTHSDNSGEHFYADTNSSSTKDDDPEGSRDFLVEGQRKDVKTIFLKLRIADTTGHVRNIHFPFDIEVDTAFSVASEMVAELDLTDQDVTTIAEMIDSEIQVHIPEWTSTKALEVNTCNDGELSHNIDSETKDELSMLAIEVDPPSNGLVLERFPSGRKYWSDSPKELSKGSPVTHSHSNFNSQKEDYETNEGKENVENLALSLSALSLSARHGESHENDVNGENKDMHVRDNQNGGLQDHEDQHSCDDKQSLEDNCEQSISEEPLDIRSVAEKLDFMLLEQQHELDELKKTHEDAITDLLKELPPETRHKLFHWYHLKIPDYRALNQAQWYARHSSDSDSSFSQGENASSRTSNSTADNNSECSLFPPSANNLSQPKTVTDLSGNTHIIHIFGKIGSRESIPENNDGRNVLRDRSNPMKIERTGSMGIDVILGE
ncbi:hypothetical protein GIB67_030889 [Kingdonia uniflora]|uniref:non-specific serine/threonine protein kinase n=1 Tax=Kingdonia uniflora TaxID=39325 RepID=A0A7J7L3D2_9MAGN|nr:hypothetical protein GIB67_030889 [Kingdonia uniflora]